MKNRRFSSGMCGVAGLVILLGACTTGMQRQDGAVQGTASLRESVAILKTKVAQSVQSLNNLEMVAAQRGDLKEAFKQYTDASRELAAQATRTRNQTAQFRSRMNTYIGAWAIDSKQIANPEIQKASDERRIKASENIEKVHAEAVRIQTGYDKLVTDQQGIRTALENDLTPAGVGALAGVMGTVRKEASTVQADLDKLMTELTRLEESLAGAPVISRDPAK